MGQLNFTVIRDCGYGKVWSRLCVDMEDAIAEREHWKREGRTDGGMNGGEFSIHPVTERAIEGGGFTYEIQRTDAPSPRELVEDQTPNLEQKA